MPSVFCQKNKKSSTKRPRLISQRIELFHSRHCDSSSSEKQVSLVILMMLPVYSTVPGSRDSVTGSLSCTIPETKAGNWNSVIINFNYTCAFPTVTCQNVFQGRKGGARCKLFYTLSVPYTEFLRHDVRESLKAALLVASSETVTLEGGVKKAKGAI